MVKNRNSTTYKQYYHRGDEEDAYGTNTREGNKIIT
jgi:hypothetical protein